MTMIKPSEQWDVLVPKVGEIIGGSQREHRLDILESRMVEQGLELDHYWWYRDLRKFGTVPHSGFGLGSRKSDSICYGHGEYPRRDSVFHERQATQIFDGDLSKTVVVGLSLTNRTIHRARYR